MRAKSCGSRETYALRYGMILGMTSLHKSMDERVSGVMVMKDEWGKSLLEIIIVLSIVAATSLVTGEAFLGATMTNQLRVVQRNMSTELRIARQWAVIRRKAIAVTFVLGGKQTRTDMYRNIGIPLRQYDFSDTGVLVQKMSKGPQVVFYPSGRTATPTTITLQNVRGRQALLTVSLTGRITIQ